jgi:hypothetical protein
VCQRSDEHFLSMASVLYMRSDFFGGVVHQRTSVKPVGGLILAIILASGRQNRAFRDRTLAPLLERVFPNLPFPSSQIRRERFKVVEQKPAQ